MIKIERTVAEQEINEWLDKKKIFPQIREANKDSVDTLVDAMSNGNLILDHETWVLTHELLFPFGDQEKVTSLSYIPRLNDKTLKQWMVGVKPSDAEGRLLGYIAALTKKPRAILEELDTVDKKIAMSIAVFFL